MNFASALVSVESFTGHQFLSSVPVARSSTTQIRLFSDLDHSNEETSRRNAIQKCLMGIFVTGSGAATTAPRPSWALKPRNEALCGTGFFTNYLEYRCTDIGDISDEGKSTAFSSGDAGAADSLLNKLNLNLDLNDTPQRDDSKKSESTLDDTNKVTADVAEKTIK